MVRWRRLTNYLNEVEDSSVTLSYTRIAEIIGGAVPSSARRWRPQFWANSEGNAYARNWRAAGFKTSLRGLAEDEVRFVRVGARVDEPSRWEPRWEAAAPIRPARSEADVLLVGCVKTKRDTPAPVRELYLSPLWQRRRAYAEASGKPWVILSAEHGVLDPDEVVAPYDRNLAGQPAAYRKQWGRAVFTHLRERFGDLAGRNVELHASRAYGDPIEPLLRRAGATLTRPLEGLTQGRHLQWYDEPVMARTASPPQTTSAAARATGPLGLRRRSPRAASRRYERTTAGFPSRRGRDSAGDGVGAQGSSTVGDEQDWSDADRRAGLDELYRLLGELRDLHGGPRHLKECTGEDGWPRHGVYFFFEDGETRDDATTPRVVRVGTHAITASSGTKLWDRLRTHRGQVGGRYPGAGNHRASVFRLHVGTALMNRHPEEFEAVALTWGDGSRATPPVRERELSLERAVSEVIGSMPLLWLAVSDRAERAAIERDCISLLSNHSRTPVDPPSHEWRRFGFLRGHGVTSESRDQLGLPA